MFEKFARSWQIGKQSLAVLRGDKQLVVFPILSSIACMLVLATFVLPLALGINWQEVMNAPKGERNLAVQWWYYPVFFGYYFANFFVITFFNSALVACALRKFQGESASVGDGLRAASQRLPQILAWSAVAATVGVILQILQERAGWIGKLVLNLIGMAWTIATFFVVPVLVVEGVGPIAAIKRSVGVLRKSWGETLISNIGLSAFAFVLALVGFALLAGGIVLGVVLNQVWVAVAAVALAVLYFIAVILVTSTLRVILLAATYQYATTGLVPEGFDLNLLKNAFAQKK